MANITWNRLTNISLPSNRLVMKYQALVPKIVFKIVNGFKKMNLYVQCKETYLTNIIRGPFLSIMCLVLKIINVAKSAHIKVYFLTTTCFAELLLVGIIYHLGAQTSVNCKI